MTLDNLLRIGKVKAHAADKVEIGRLLTSAERALADVGVPGLSADTRLDAAYRALLQAALAAMLANGYRPDLGMDKPCSRPGSAKPAGTCGYLDSRKKVDIRHMLGHAE
jgi:hypothetical protein